jgi:SAM-dependent methyltransferase/chromosome segregation ATPase
MHRIGFSLPPRYVSRARPEYHHEDSVAESGVTWQPEVYELAGEFAKARSLNTVVDIGCGSGLKLEAIDVQRRVGVDFGPNLDWCREHHSWGEWIEADFETEDLRKIEPLLGPDTVVICADVVEHLVDPDPLIQLWRKAYNAGSLVITSTPDRVRVRGADHMGPPGNPAHVREWQLDEYISLLKSRRLPVTAAGWTIDNDRDRQLMTIVTVHDGAESSISSPLLSVAGGPVRFDALRPVIDGLRATYAGPVRLDDLPGLDFDGELTIDSPRKGRTGGLKMSADGTQQSMRATRGSAAINPLVDRVVMLVADSEANRARSLAAEREAEAVRVQLSETRAQLDEANRQKNEVANIARRATEELQKQFSVLSKQVKSLESEVASEGSRAFTTRLEQELIHLRTLVQQSVEHEPHRRATEAQAAHLAARLAQEAEARRAAEVQRDELAQKVETQTATMDAQRATIESLQTEASYFQAETHRLSQEVADHFGQAESARVEKLELSAQLARETDSRRAAEVQRDELAQTVETQTATLESQRSMIELLQAQATTLRTEADRLSRELAGHIEQLGDLRGQIVDLDVKRSDQVAENSELRASIKRAEIKLSVKIAENLQLRDGLWRQQNATQVAVQEANGCRQRCEHLEAEVAAVRARADGDRHRLESDTAALMASRATEVEGTRTELDVVRRDLAETQLSAKRLRMRIATANLENFTLRDSVWRLQNELGAVAAELQSRSNAYELQINQLGAAANSLQAAEIAALRSDIINARRAHDDLLKNLHAAMQQVTLQSGRMHVPAAVARVYYTVRKYMPSPIVRGVARMTTKKPQ